MLLNILQRAGRLHNRASSPKRQHTMADKPQLTLDSAEFVKQLGAVSVIKVCRKLCVCVCVYLNRYDLLDLLLGTFISLFLKYHSLRWFVWNL